MNEDQLKEYKTKLEGERESLLAEIKEVEKNVDFGSDVDHGEEAADKTEDEANRTAMAKELKDRLSEIEIALEKIPHGRYGVCEKCGGAIESEILDVDPESRFCKKDKS